MVGIETNAFGLHEFVDWAREADVEIVVRVTLPPLSWSMIELS